MFFCKDTRFSVAFIWPSGVCWFGIRSWFDQVYDSKMLTGSLEIAVTYFMIPKVTVTLVGLTILWPQKVTGSWEVTVTYFMTPKVTVTFVVDLTYFMTPNVTVTFVVGLT